MRRSLSSFNIFNASEAGSTTSSCVAVVSVVRNGCGRCHRTISNACAFVCSARPPLLVRRSGPVLPFKFDFILDGRPALIFSTFTAGLAALGQRPYFCDLIPLRWGGTLFWAPLHVRVVTARDRLQRGVLPQPDAALSSSVFQLGWRTLLLSHAGPGGRFPDLFHSPLSQFLALRRLCSTSCNPWHRLPLLRPLTRPVLLARPPLRGAHRLFLPVRGTELISLASLILLFLSQARVATHDANSNSQPL